MSQQKQDRQWSKIDLVKEARRIGCSGCIYFSIGDPSEIKGHCRRSAPTREARTEVSKDYWCGEFFPL